MNVLCRLGIHAWDTAWLPEGAYWYRKCVECPRKERKNTDVVGSKWKKYKSKEKMK